MKTALVFVGLLLLATAGAQQHNEPPPKGVIYGIAIGQDRQPAKGIVLTAYPLGVPLGTALPATRTNEAGEYRFENLPWWGRYTVYAEDEDAGYSSFSTGPAGDSHPSEVELTPERREAEFKVYLPPRAGFLQIRLTNRKTGAGISAMRIALMLAENPVSQFFSASCYSNHVILIPPEKHLLLHVTSDGFQEWEQSTGMGKPIYLPSGARLTLDVQLEPVRPQGEAAPGTARGIVGDVPGGLPPDGASPTTGILLSSEPRSPRVASPTHIRVAQGVMRSFLITKVNPSYPPEAERQHVDGTVLLRINIDKNGNVATVEPVTGHPLLIPAAIDAVKQWKYKSYLLNQTAVEVETTVLIKFVISSGNAYSVIAFASPNPRSWR
jgi:TonB family protein